MILLLGDNDLILSLGHSEDDGGVDDDIDEINDEINDETDDEINDEINDELLMTMMPPSAEE